MTSKERIIKTLNFEKPDRIGRHHLYWEEFEDNFKKEKGMDEANLDDYFREDIYILYPDEGPFPSKECSCLKMDGNSIYQRDTWGRIIRKKNNAKFIEVVETELKDKSDIDRMAFEPADIESRYSNIPDINQLKQRYCVFLKIGGFFQRTSWLRGEEEFLVDIALEPEFVKELASRTADHILGIGLEALKRWDLYDTGVWLFDDIGSNRGTVISPASFEGIFYPQYRKVISGLKKAGVNKILFHSDGNIEGILDMLVDAGVNVINPVEPRSGMDVAKLRKKYGKKLCMIGGADNINILPRGSRKEIEDMTIKILDVAKDGGVVIGVHSVGPDIPVANYEYYINLIDKYGVF